MTSSSTSRVSSLALLLLSSSSSANAASLATTQSASPILVNPNGQVAAQPASTSSPSSSARISSARTMSSSVPPGQAPVPSASSSVLPGAPPSSVAVDTSSPPPAAPVSSSSSVPPPPAATPTPTSTPPPAAPSTTSDPSTSISSSTIISTTSSTSLPPTTTTTTSDIPSTTSTSFSSTSDLITSTSISLLPTTSSTSSSIFTTSTSAFPAATSSAAPVVASPSVNYGHVAAGIVGTCAGLALVGVIVFFLRRRYVARKARENDNSSNSDDPFFGNSHPFAAQNHLSQPMSNRASMLGPSVAPFFRRPRPQSVISDITDLTTPSTTLPAYDEKLAGTVAVRERQETPSPVSPISIDEKTSYPFFGAGAQSKAQELNQPARSQQVQVQNSSPKRTNIQFSNDPRQIPSQAQIPNWQTSTHNRLPIPSQAAQNARRKVFANGVPPITHTTYNLARSSPSQHQSQSQPQQQVQQQAPASAQQPRRSEDRRAYPQPMHVAPQMTVQMRTPEHRQYNTPYANASVKPSPSSVYTAYTPHSQVRYEEPTPPVPQRAEGHGYVNYGGNSPYRPGHERKGSRFSENL